MLTVPWRFDSPNGHFYKKVGGYQLWPTSIGKQKSSIDVKTLKRFAYNCISIPMVLSWFLTKIFCFEGLMYSCIEAVFEQHPWFSADFLFILYWTSFILYNFEAWQTESTVFWAWHLLFFQWILTPRRNFVQSELFFKVSFFIGSWVHFRDRA